MRSAERAAKDRIARKLLGHSERVVEHAEQVKQLSSLIVNSAIDLRWTAEPEQVRQRAEVVRAGVLRAVALLLEVSGESGALLGLVQTGEALDEDHLTSPANQ